MADEKSKNLTGADGPGKDPAQPGAGGSPAPGKEQKAPEAAAPEKTVKEQEKAAKEPEKTAPEKEAKEPEKPAPEKDMISPLLGCRVTPVFRLSQTIFTGVRQRTGTCSHDRKAMLFHSCLLRLPHRSSGCMALLQQTGMPLHAHRYQAPYSSLTDLTSRLQPLIRVYARCGSYSFYLP